MGQEVLNSQFERLGLAVEHQSNITNNVDTGVDDSAFIIFGSQLKFRHYIVKLFYCILHHEFIVYV